MAQSIMDYIFRRLALDYLPFETRASLGIYSTAERTRQLETGSYETAEDDDFESLKQSAAEDSTPTPRDAQPVAAGHATAPLSVAVHSSAELMELKQGRTADAPLCMSCGIKMRPAGSCYVCEGCGSTSGCS